MLDNRIRLRDGRALGYAEYGDPQGRPVLYFHGFPGSRLEAKLAEPVAARLNVRLIAVDRPGFGLSDFLPGRLIEHWPDDVSELADALGLDTFAVLGVSGGAPYASACAWKIPGRLRASGIVAGLGPLDVRGGSRGIHGIGRPALLFSRRAPGLARPVFELLAWSIRRNPARFLARFTAKVPEPDRRALQRDEVREVLVASFREAVRAGAKGPARDLFLYTRPWGFKLGDIQLEVSIWHGELDMTVPPSMGRSMAKAIPKCRFRMIPGEGHFSLPVNHMEEILGALKG